MGDFERWLAGLGMAEYAQRFAEQQVDFSVLPDLTDADLKELALPLGHRRKLLRAIAELQGRAAAAAAEPARRDSAERRQLTVMFCDLAGSTELSARLDPEDMREVIRAYQQACASVVRAYDGFLAKFMGDGVLVYFGYPRAHEGDAERAVRAGLDIAAAVGRLDAHGQAPPKVRIGIATGAVVVGDLVGEGAAQERAVVGDTPNIAARLQALAEPGAVLIAASTRRLIGNLFHLRDLGDHAVKGYPEPIRAWVVEGARAHESRFEATRASGLTGFVGREQQIERLIDCKRRAWAGQGRVVLISGEPGIGKSRLAASLAERLSGEPHLRLRYQCSAYHSNSALYPFIQQLRLAAGIDPAAPPSEQLDKLETLLSLATRQVASVAPLFAALLAIPAGGRYPALEVSPAQQRRQTLQAFLEQFEGLARRRPILLLFEDVHWADATSRDLIDMALERVHQLPVLAIVTFRPEFAAPWGGRPEVTTLALERLEPAQVRAMVHWLAGGKHLPAEVMTQIVAKTDGIPLFVEELTKAVLESGLLIEESGEYRLAGPLPPLAIPATLQDSLMARLDRLDSVGYVAQVGAAIGRSFSYPMIAAVTGLDEGSIRAALERLVDAELIFARGTPPEADYSFKHALVQDAAYESLLKSRRQALHARIVETIEARFPELVEAESEVLAQHCARADLTQKAVVYWMKAGANALLRSNLAEAETHLQAAIRLLATQPESTERLRQELACQTMLAQALIAAKGYGAAETMAAWRRAQALAAAVGSAEQRFAINYGLWVGQYAQGDLRASLALADDCLRAAETAGERTQLCVAQRMNGIARLVTGDFARAREHCARAVDLYDPALHPRLASQLGHDLLVAALSFTALSLWPLGYPDQARRAITSVLAHAKRLGHAPSLAYTYWHAGVIGVLMLREEALLAEHVEALLTLAVKHGFALWEWGGRIAQGWLRARAGGGSAAVEQMRAALGALRRTGQRVNDTMNLALLGEAQAATGDVAGGLQSIAEGIALGESTQQAFWLAELYRLQGALRLMAGADRTGAEAALRRALAVARQQEARSWELRAAIDLAALLADDGRAGEGEALLASAYRGLTEGFDSPDLRTARALAARLRSARNAAVPLP
jgi:class 3 adenylate cyclase/predicted ATPase